MITVFRSLVLQYNLPGFNFQEISYVTRQVTGYVSYLIQSKLGLFSYLIPYWAHRVEFTVDVSKHMPVATGDCWNSSLANRGIADVTITYSRILYVLCYISVDQRSPRHGSLISNLTNKGKHRRPNPMSCGLCRSFLCVRAGVVRFLAVMEWFFSF